MDMKPVLSNPPLYHLIDSGSPKSTDMMLMLSLLFVVDFFSLTELTTYPDHMPDPIAQVAMRTHSQDQLVFLIIRTNPSIKIASP